MDTIQDVEHYLRSEYGHPMRGIIVGRYIGDSGERRAEVAALCVRLWREGALKRGRPPEPVIPDMPDLGDRTYPIQNDMGKVVGWHVGPIFGDEKRFRSRARALDWEARRIAFYWCRPVAAVWATFVDEPPRLETAREREINAAIKARWAKATGRS